MKNYWTFLGLIIFLGFGLTYSYKKHNSWNPDAGLVYSFTENAKIQVSSNAKEAAKILDENLETAWQSEAPLPNGFITRTDLNIFLDRAKEFCKSSSKGPFVKCTDGDLNTAIKIVKNGKEASLIFDLKTESPIFSISIKCGIQKDLTIFGHPPNQEKIKLATYSKSENYQLKRFEISGKFERLSFVSSESFEVFEIAALEDLPTEFAVIDFGKPENIGTVYSKHWAGDKNAQTTNLYWSHDNIDWQFIGKLNPENIHTYITNVKPSITARYLKIEHQLIPKDWNKVFIWELKVYDENGHYGAKPISAQSNVSLGEMLGVNGYWSWGTNEYADQLDENAGPKLYAPLASHARNYHDLTWDLKSPDDKIDFSKMATNGGTPAKEWLNWDKEYKAWGKENLNIQASIQFFRFEQNEWKFPYQSAYNYGKNYAQHFGASKGNGYICSMEVGNEPWKYDAPIYQEILLGMSKGAKEGDPKMEVFPCALQAADPDMEKTGIFKNYIGVRIPEAAKNYLEGINIHTYSYVNNFWGKRIGIFPEHQNSSFWEILNAIRWRDQNMPGKKIYLSEWGWDGAGGGESCTHSECVTEEAAAYYAVRGAMIALRFGLDRATWYFYANTENQSSLYTRSGLTGSPDTKFQKKKVFNALQALVENVGDKYFLESILETEDAWIYLLGNPEGKATHLIAWRPIDGNVHSPMNIRWKTNYKSKNAILLDGKTEEGTKTKLPVIKDGEMILNVNALPLLVELG